MIPVEYIDGKKVVGHRKLSPLATYLRSLTEYFLVGAFHSFFRQDDWKFGESSKTVLEKSSGIVQI